MSLKTTASASALDLSRSTTSILPLSFKIPLCLLTLLRLALLLHLVQKQASVLMSWVVPRFYQSVVRWTSLRSWYVRTRRTVSHLHCLICYTAGKLTDQQRRRPAMQPARTVPKRCRSSNQRQRGHRTQRRRALRFPSGYWVRVRADALQSYRVL